MADPFSGTGFDHLSTLTTSIIGPRLLLYCLATGREVPNLPYPLCTATMLGISVTFTGLEGTHLTRLESLVRQMAGTVSKDYHDGVTHLVAAKVSALIVNCLWVFLKCNADNKQNDSTSSCFTIGRKPKVQGCDFTRCANHEACLG